jgi:hypothetical protein
MSTVAPIDISDGADVLEYMMEHFDEPLQEDNEDPLAHVRARLPVIRQNVVEAHAANRVNLAPYLQQAASEDPLQPARQSVQNLWAICQSERERIKCLRDATVEANGVLARRLEEHVELRRKRDEYLKALKEQQTINPHEKGLDTWVSALIVTCNRQ